MVSVRMPKSLLKKLEELVKKHHFLDLSEEVRSIIRKKWLEASKPELFEIRKIGEDIGKELRKKSEEKIQEEIAKELQKIREQLRKGGFYNE